MPNRAHLTQRLAVFAIAVALFVAVYATQVRAQQDPVDFLKALQSETIGQLTDSSLGEAEKEQRAHELFQRYFDTPAIGRFVIGRYWRKASEQEQKDFLTVFQEVIVQRFVPLFEEQSDSRFTFSTQRQDEKHPEMSFVSSKIETNSNEVIKVVWRVREKDGAQKILDVIIEGASMALTLRSEYSSFIKSSGGKIASLTKSLRDKVERGAFRGDVN